MGTRHFCSFPPILASRPGKVPCSESQFHVCQQGSASQKWGEPKVKNIVCKIVPPKRAMWNGSYRGGSSKRVMCLCVVRVQLFPPLHSEMWEWLVPEFCFRVTARNHWRCRWRCKPSQLRCLTSSSGNTQEMQPRNSHIRRSTSEHKETHCWLQDAQKAQDNSIRKA